MQPLVQSLLFGGVAAATVIAVLPHVSPQNSPPPNEKYTPVAAPVKTVRAASSGQTQTQTILPRTSTQPAINQYHVQVIEPAAGWQRYMPCLRPPASFRADMPCRQPEGILGTNRTVTPPVRTTVRPR
ncbi:MAG: hypothetical protein K6U75_13460 [Firmicutes bacterium]|nr:hypothetical protein [Bacillota bacterium]